MGVDAVDADAHDIRYFLGGHASGDMAEYFYLPGRKHRLGRVGVQVTLDFFADDALARRCAPDRRYELLVERVLHDYAGGSRIERLTHFIRRAECGENQYFRIRVLGTDFKRCLHAVLLRHHQVHQNDVRFELSGEPYGFDAVSGFSDYGNVGFLSEYGCESHPDNLMVVGDDYFQFSSHFRTLPY